MGKTVLAFACSKVGARESVLEGRSLITGLCVIVSLSHSRGHYDISGGFKNSRVSVGLKVAHVRCIKFEKYPKYKEDKNHFKWHHAEMTAVNVSIHLLFWLFPPLNILMV